MLTTRADFAQYAESILAPSIQTSPCWNSERRIAKSLPARSWREIAKTNRQPKIVTLVSNPPWDYMCRLAIHVSDGGRQQLLIVSELRRNSLNRKWKSVIKSRCDCPAFAAPTHTWGPTTERNDSRRPGRGTDAPPLFVLRPCGRRGTRVLMLRVFSSSHARLMVHPL